VLQGLIYSRPIQKIVDRQKTEKYIIYKVPFNDGLFRSGQEKCRV
jgi:hypothetical protein